MPPRALRSSPEGDFDAVRGYHLGKGLGLIVVQSRCLKKDTIYNKATMDSTSGFRCVMGSEGWVDHGFYVNKLMSLSKSGGIVCPELSAQGGSTSMSSRKGVVSIYVHGYPCGSKKCPMTRSTRAIRGGTTFKDDGTEEPAGWVKRIHIWGKALPKKKVMSLCGCILPSKGKDNE